MAKKLKKLLSGLVFLAPEQREKLISVLPKLTSGQKKEMFENFSSIKKKEKALIKKFLENNPEAISHVGMLIQKSKKRAVNRLEEEEHSKEMEDIEKLLN